MGQTVASQFVKRLSSRSSWSEDSMGQLVQSCPGSDDVLICVMLLVRSKVPEGRNWVEGTQNLSQNIRLLKEKDMGQLGRPPGFCEEIGLPPA